MQDRELTDLELEAVAAGKGRTVVKELSGRRSIRDTVPLVAKRSA